EGGKAVALVCQVMKLGAKDSSGRASPEATSEIVELPCTAIIPAISQAPVLDFAAGTKIASARGAIVVNAEAQTGEPDVFAGGDAVHGPSSVVQAIADGRAFAEAFAKRVGISISTCASTEKNVSSAANLAKKAIRTNAAPIPTLAADKRTGFDLVHGCLSAEAAQAEASRCLECDKLCNICVTVCPNRANQAYRVGPLALNLPRYQVKDGGLIQIDATELYIAQAIQTFNLADSCNECGNCQTFCPSAGAPYQDKPRIWLDREGFEEGKGDRFHFHRVGDAIELEACLDGQLHRLKMDGGIADYVGPFLSAKLDTTSGTFSQVSLGAGASDGAELSLEKCGLMVALFAASKVLPL
ncbi:MAG: hypothetical protein LBM75_01610, partial [Myxococcales bacterium]|nr:hypothetical protein [Myxococcales bacterium]